VNALRTRVIQPGQSLHVFAAHTAPRSAVRNGRVQEVVSLTAETAPADMPRAPRDECNRTHKELMSQPTLTVFQCERARIASSVAVEETNPVVARTSRVRATEEIESSSPDIEKSGVRS